MLARRSFLQLPDGQSIELPLLVPSFSSKGFAFSSTRRKGKTHLVSGITLDLHEFAQKASKSVLISAYDLYFEHFNRARGLKGGPLDWLSKSQVVFLDSGGYELALDFDSSEPKTPTYKPLPGYGLAQYLNVIKTIVNDPLQRSFIVTNFDRGTRGRPLSDQVVAARRVFQLIPGQLHSFIIKPWRPGGTEIEPSDLSQTDVRGLKGFHVIGVTEKELGKDQWSRLQRIARLRHILDKAGINAPIHVWGGLDPVMTVLYFFAGAQIFDGVSWLRYAYVNGMAVNRESFLPLSGAWAADTKHEVCRQIISLANRSVLDDLAMCMRTWVDRDGQDFSMFGEAVREPLERTYQSMHTAFDELKGVS